nr:MAG TPA: hypothetical protein [Caudoviricetes sp.]
MKKRFFSKSYAFFSKNKLRNAIFSFTFTPKIAYVNSTS